MCTTTGTAAAAVAPNSRTAVLLPRPETPAGDSPRRVVSAALKVLAAFVLACTFAPAAPRRAATTSSRAGRVTSGCRCTRRSTPARSTGASSRRRSRSDRPVDHARPVDPRRDLPQPRSPRLGRVRLGRRPERVRTAGRPLPAQRRPACDLQLGARGDRVVLRGRAGPSAPAVRLRAVRLDLAWSYWSSPQNCIQPAYVGAVAAGMTPAAFRALLTSQLGVPTVSQMLTTRQTQSVTQTRSVRKLSPRPVVRGLE